MILRVNVRLSYCPFLGSLKLANELGKWCDEVLVKLKVIVVHIDG